MSVAIVFSIIIIGAGFCGKIYTSKKLNDIDGVSSFALYHKENQTKIINPQLDNI